MRSVDLAVEIGEGGTRFIALPSKYYGNEELPNIPKKPLIKYGWDKEMRLTFLQYLASILSYGEYERPQVEGPRVVSAAFFETKTDIEIFLENPSIDTWGFLSGTERKKIIAKIEHLLSKQDQAYINLFYLEKSEKSVIGKVVEIIREALNKNSPITVRSRTLRKIKEAMHEIS